MNILGKVQPNKDDGDFLPEEELENTGKQPPSKPNAHAGGDLMKLLGGMGKVGNKPLGEDRPNGDWEYTNSEEMTTNYIPISKTYKPLKYEGPTYEAVEYEPPTYEPASQMLFGEQGKSWENSPVFKDTGIGKILQERGDFKSVFDEDKELKDILFGGNKPADDDLSGRLFGISNKPEPVITQPTQLISNKLDIPVIDETAYMEQVVRRIAEREPYSSAYHATTPFTDVQNAPIYNKSQPTPMPQSPIKKKGGRPFGSKNGPPGGRWEIGISQTK